MVKMRKRKKEKKEKEVKEKKQKMCQAEGRFEDRQPSKMQMHQQQHLAWQARMTT